jgi:hypothetical protein
MVKRLFLLFHAIIIMFIWSFKSLLLIKVTAIILIATFSSLFLPASAPIIIASSLHLVSIEIIPSRPGSLQLLALFYVLLSSQKVFLKFSLSLLISWIVTIIFLYDILFKWSRISDLQFPLKIKLIIMS